MAEEKTVPGPGPSLDLATENEWEVVNDDGFVFKRQKSKRDASPPILINITINNDDQYSKQRRLLKKTGLINLKTRYAREIGEWESLSQMSQTTVTSVINSSINPLPSSSSLPRTQMQNARKYIFRELLQQVTTHSLLIAELLYFFMLGFICLSSCPFPSSGRSPGDLHPGCNESLQCCRVDLWSAWTRPQTTCSRFSYLGKPHYTSAQPMPIWLWGQCLIN